MPFDVGNLVRFFGHVGLVAAGAASFWGLIFHVRGRSDRRQVFLALHNWHSIFTLGTVITVDFLYLASAHHHRLKAVLYRFFPAMSAVILAGLGFDYLSNFLVLDEAFAVTPQFLFSQTVTAVVIINGALLSGDINAALIDSLHSASSPFFSPRFRTAIRVSGATSIISWLTITFVDFFVLPFSYPVMLLAYVFAVAGAVGFERLTEGRLKSALGRLVPEPA